MPEGLPMMITLVLSSNMKRLLKNNVLVRKLMGIETAGSLNILFSDKTGTITKGKLEVIEFIDGDFNSYYNIESISNELQKLVLLSITQNNDSCYADGKIVGGNITDRALLKFSSNLKVSANVVDTIPFNSSLKYSQAKVKYNNQDYFLLKGAPEVILPKCNGYYDKSGTRRYLRSKIKVNEFISNKTYLGNRVLMLAIGKSVSDLTMVGIVLIKDEVRKEAIEGINLVKKAHIQTVMVTGDNKDTAICIAKEAGLYENGDLCITSDDLSRLHDEEVKKIIPRLKIVARAIPQDKSRLVRLSQEMDLVVGMTGDGVNDAPALKKADVGFAMGSGCEVAKEASDIVVLDDNFLSIAKAILFGRTIFKSIRKFIIFQLTVNICAVSLSIIGPFIGIDTPVTVIQMLWINMVMDTLAALAFAYEPPLPEYMEEEPKKRDEPILNRYMRDEIIFTGTYSAILCVLFLKLPIFSELFREAENQKYLLTAFFGLFIFMGIFNSFNARTHRLNLFAHLFKNKVFIVIISFIAIVQVLLIYFGGDVFRTAGLSLKEFQIMFLLSLTVIPVDWVRKIILRKKGIIGGV
jgi:Ca2+-transporting ATPase